MIEVLSPAGTFESFRAAVAAGADAVYLGGTMFGARAFAGNFNKEELLRAIDYAHVRGKRVYLTVNTLLKEDELQNRLYHYLLPFYREGLDAVIVQDYGVFDFIKKNFPEIDIHASTQMTITGHNGAGLLKRLGAKRVVTARELNLNEIRRIREESDIEIESFVHGALCYCYSGQCLMSSLIGGRSGNRGRCAQACRLPYDVFMDGKQVNGDDSRYVLSPKDMCALPILPSVIESGVNSLKIEGRMKTPEYTAGVVAMYRKYVDLYMEKGKQGFHVLEEDMEKLMDLYNRGNFTEGYFFKKNGKDMLSLSRPNHQGVRALKVVSAGKGRFTAKPLTTLHAGDVIQIAPEYELTIGAKDAGAAVLSYNIPAKFRVDEGEILYRTRNKELVDTIKSKYLETEARVPVSVCFELHCNEPARLTLTCSGRSVTVEGALVLRAQNKPVTEEQMTKQLSKFGSTPFWMKDCRIVMDENIFISVGSVNELRREAAGQLEHALYEAGYRNSGEKSFFLVSGKYGEMAPIWYSAGIMRECQIRPVAEAGIFKRVYLDASVCEKERLTEITEKLKKCGMEVYLAFPQIFRQQTEQLFDDMDEILRSCNFDGYLIKSLCELEYVSRKGLTGRLISDYNMHIFNSASREFLSGLGISQMTASAELNERELEELGTDGMEILGYGYYPMMVSAQCVMNTINGCAKGGRHENGMIYLKDRKSKRMAVRNDCRFCYSVIYNESPVYLFDYMDRFEHMKASSVRAAFTIEDEKETKGIITDIKKGRVPEKYTRGHFTRGVE